MVPKSGTRTLNTVAIGGAIVLKIGLVSPLDSTAKVLRIGLSLLEIYHVATNGVNVSIVIHQINSNRTVDCTQYPKEKESDQGSDAS